MRPFVTCAIVALTLIFQQFSLAAEAETLPRDPANVYGQFDSGLKYIIRKNQNPPGKVSLNLHLRTGALNETDAQNGLAHFIEHMAFNGSEHFKPGELIPLLNKMGMIFGADSNAHTTFHETVYKLTMPDTKPETIDLALTIFGDYASSLNFSDKEIDSERGVILEESRSRKSAEERIQKKMFKEVFAGTQLSKHDIIGDEELIKTMPRSEFVDYWNTWYRPENMTLIVAGDINPDEIVAKAKEKLGSVKARGASRQPQGTGLSPTQSSKAFILTDPEQVGGEIGMLTVQRGRGALATFDQFQQRTVENLGEWIVNRRFGELVRKGGAPFRQAHVDSEDFFGDVLLVDSQAEGEPEDWNKMLDVLIAEISRAIDHGFTTSELELAKSSTLASAQRAVETESTRDSGGIVAELSFQVGLQRPIMSAKQRVELVKKVLDPATVDEVHKSFVANFKTRNCEYILTMPEKKEGLKLPTTEEILAAANAAWAKKTEAPAEQKLAGNILASEPDAGKVATTDTDKDLELTTVTFANGAVMHHKFVDYKKDQVFVQVTLPGGEIAETADNRGVSDVASLMVGQPATSRFTSSQVRDLMTGKNVHVGGGVGLDSLSLSISGSNKDLPAGLQLGYAILTDGVLEQSALDEWKKQQLQMLAKKKSNAELQVIDAMAATVFGGDIRMTPLTEAMISRQERPAAEAWFKKIASRAAIEVAVVGDIKLEDATALVAKYIGSLPQRAGKFDEFDQLRKINRGPGPYAKTSSVQTITPAAIVLAGFISCDEIDPARRPLSLASLILTDRMHERIREQEQLVYSIQAFNQPGQAIHGTGLMIAFAPTAPNHADKLGDVIIEMMKEFAEKGPTNDELDVAKKQIANQLDNQMKEPGFWLQQIATLNYRSRPLSEIKSLPGIFQTFTTDQVRDAVKKFLKDDSIVRIEIVPESATTTKPTAPTAETK